MNKLNSHGVDNKAGPRPSLRAIGMLSPGPTMDHTKATPVDPKFTRLFHTIRHLKSKQIFYRLFYACYKPIIKPFKQLPLKCWLKHWDAPLVMSSPMRDSGEITFLHETGHLNENCLWNNPIRSKLWLYNVHYFDVLNAKEANNRIELAQSLIQKWIDENPSLYGNGWEPYPLSLRVINWIKWFSRYPELVQPHWLDSLAMQVVALNKQIEYHIGGNHLFANAKTLVFAGCYFDGPQANHWLMKGMRILASEVAEQFLSDGGHFERSPMYHASMLWDMCDLVNLAEKSDNVVLLSQKVQWQAVIDRGLDWLSCMVHPDGDITFFNDAAFGIAPSLDDLLLYSQQLGIKWLKKKILGIVSPGTTEPRPSGNENPLANARGSDSSSETMTEAVLSMQLLHNTGYCSVNLANNGKAIIDVAKIGPDYQPGHAHADTLSFELSLYGQRFLVNSGTSQYGDSAQRLFERSTKAHNTVCIDGKNSSEVWGGFRVAQRAYPHDLSIFNRENNLYIGCSHNGYERLSGRNGHHREWVFSKNNVVIHDVISGRFCIAEARLYLHPNVRIIKKMPQSVLCCMADGQEILINLNGASELYVESTHWYPYFGVSVQNTCLIATFKENKLETQITW